MLVQSKKTPTIHFKKKNQKFQSCYLLWSYFESAWKMQQNEYKQAYV